MMFRLETVSQPADERVIKRGQGFLFSEERVHLTERERKEEGPH